MPSYKVGSLLTSKQLQYRLAELLVNVERVDVISAYITMPAVKWFLKRAPKSKFTFVARMNIQDVRSGSTCLNSLELALKQGHNVLRLSGLHAKLYKLDDSHIFTGSANSTANGLGISSTPNLESACMVPADHENLLFVEKIIRASQEIEVSHIEKMRNFIENQIDSRNVPTLDDWPLGLFDAPRELFISDLPQAGLNESAVVYESEDFRRIRELLKSNDISGAKGCFLTTPIIKWLHSNLSEDDYGVNFGEVSALLHDALADDPSPYRRDIKKHQAYLYEFIQCLLPDRYEITIPGARSQVIRVIND